MAPVQKKYKKYDLKFKLSVVKYAEENSGEAAARRFSVDSKRVRDWRKSKAELQRLSQEDGSRARLPGGGRKKASEELEKNMRDWVVSKRARHEKVSRSMIRSKAKQMYATVSDGRDEEFAASVGWLNRFLPRNNFTGNRQTAVGQEDATEFTEKLVKFVTCSSQVIETKKIPDRDIIAMAETAVCFDMVLSTSVETRGVCSVPLKTTGHEKSQLTVVVAAKADGTKLKPFVVFKRAARELRAMQSTDGVVVASSKDGLMNDDLTADWLQKVVGKSNRGPRLLVWDSDRCHISQATKEELKRGYKMTTAVIPGECTKLIQAPEVVWNQPFKASLHESYASWVAGNVDKTYTAEGNMRAPDRRLLVAWVLKAWEELDTELVKKSFKVCGLNVAADGSEDHLIHFFKEGEPCAAGREMLAQARQGDQEDDGEAEQQEEHEGEEFEIEPVVAVDADEDSKANASPPDVKPLLVIKDEASSEWSPSMDQKNPEPRHIKEEQEQLLSSQGKEQLNGRMEADITRFPFTAVTVKSEDDEEKPQTSQLLQSLTGDYGDAEPPTSSSATQIKTENDREDCGGSEPSLDHPQLNTDEKASDCSKTDVSFGDWQEPLLDSGPETEDIDCGCNYCGSKFSLKSNLKRHMQAHKGQKPYGCDVCGNRFGRQGSLKAHMRVHKGDKPFGCDTSGKGFNRSARLKANKRVHTDEKPFGCGVCGKRYKQAGRLKSHAKIHSG